ncbi:MAG: hypothetical protein IPP94_00580 [Ignavibacteria bacterium]|nr:hypothetical protein [Ignavibacteria bacterium]
MKRIRPITALLALSMLPVFSSAQAPDAGRTLVCGTNDGTLLITSESVNIRDYRFEFDGFAERGIVRLIDRRSGTTAELDSRSDEGLYFVIRETTASMQLVAPRTKMYLRGADGEGSQPVSGRPMQNLIALAQSPSLATAR